MPCNSLAVCFCTSTTIASIDLHMYVCQSSITLHSTPQFGLLTPPSSLPTRLFDDCCLHPTAVSSLNLLIPTLRCDSFLTYTSLKERRHACNTIQQHCRFVRYDDPRLAFHLPSKSITMTLLPDHSPTFSESTLQLNPFGRMQKAIVPQGCSHPSIHSLPDGMIAMPWSSNACKPPRKSLAGRLLSKAHSLTGLDTEGVSASKCDCVSSVRVLKEASGKSVSQSVSIERAEQSCSVPAKWGCLL